MASKNLNNWNGDFWTANWFFFFFALSRNKLVEIDRSIDRSEHCARDAKMEQVSYLLRTKWMVNRFDRLLDFSFGSHRCKHFANIKLQTNERPFILIKTWLFMVGRCSMFDDVFFSSLHLQYMYTQCLLWSTLIELQCLWLTVPFASDF